MPKKKTPTQKDTYGVKRLGKSISLSANKIKGKLGEERFEATQKIVGNDCIKVHTGRDFIVQNRDFLGHPIGKPISVEIKTGQQHDYQRRSRRRKEN